MTIHGANHPITTSVQRFCRSNTSKVWFLNAFDRMRMTTAEEILGGTHGETICMKIALCYRLRRLDQNEREAVLEEALRTAERHYGPRHDLTLRALLDRAQFYLNGMHDFAVARSGFEEVPKKVLSRVQC